MSSVVIRDNRLQVVGDNNKSAMSRPGVIFTPKQVDMLREIAAPLLCSIPVRKMAILGDLSGAGEMFHCESLTETITSPNTGIVYHYCGVSDGIAYYRTKEQLAEIAEIENERTSQ